MFLMNPNKSFKLYYKGESVPVASFLQQSAIARVCDE